MPFHIWNRRYTGSKYKLAGWIDDLIKEYCPGGSFCDMFAGTGVVAWTELERFDRIILNDLLYSNYAIYTAFFSVQKYDMGKLKELADEWIHAAKKAAQGGFICENYGGKYFSSNDAKTIDFLRARMEEAKGELNEKEYTILLASLLYSADRAANTVGHYDAYIKGKPPKDRFQFDFVSPCDFTVSHGENSPAGTIEIYREDANMLARRLTCDVVYVDPPYNSRQYSRFYHVLETIAKGDSPRLFGEALKPAPENMSDYCRQAATEVFRDLIDHLDCRYIVISYNNTYDSKSSSSRNKIELEEIVKALECRGDVSVHERQHPYFNAGKTEFSNHREYVFIAKVKQPEARRIIHKEWTVPVSVL